VKPYYDNGKGITIFNADCRDILPVLELGSVDLVLTDPPYGVGYVTARRSHNHPLAVPIVGDESLAMLSDTLPMLDRCLRNDRHAYIFASHSNLGEAQATVAAIWPIKNTIIWDKGDAGTVGDLYAGYGVNWEAVIYASKGRRILNGPRPRCIYRYDWAGRRDPVHPMVKPVCLFEWFMLKSTHCEELVIDPFMGSGPCLQAARNLGRRCIGIEVEEKYCHLAAQRLEQEVLPLNMEGVKKREAFDNLLMFDGITAHAKST